MLFRTLVCILLAVSPNEEVASPKPPILRVTADAKDGYTIDGTKVTYDQLVDRAKQTTVASITVEGARGLQRVCTAILGFEVQKPAFLIEDGGTWPATWEDSEATEPMKRNCRNPSAVSIEEDGQ